MSGGRLYYFNAEDKHISAYNMISNKVEKENHIFILIVAQGIFLFLATWRQITIITHYNK